MTAAPQAAPASLAPTEKFSDRVEDYNRCRPGYPPEILAPLRKTCGLTSKSTVADIGSGTGLLTQPFLDNGNRVWAVEPNNEMRTAAERNFLRQPLFTSVNGTAEASGLESGSMDFVTAGQAFHWFDSAKTIPEFRRILKPDGWVVLIWNHRLHTASDFMVEYEDLLQKQCPQYKTRTHRDHAKSVKEIFAKECFYYYACGNQQSFDLAGLKGRLLSSSYSLTAGDAGYQIMIDELHALFQQHEVAGQIKFEYETRVYFGHI